MSTTIDQRVVEMRFDNKHFESNVSTTMSTLDKLKRSLNLTGASKGLESINTASKNINLNGLSGAVETVQAKFSALGVIGVTALANITNSAVNAGKKIINALTLEPITTGFKEYETQINAVQTILANTSHNGTTIDQVNEALDTLNTYADKTIYNFTEMTRNIGTFTAAGIDLQTSVDSIQGIANLAALSGSTSQQASTAMYQLSQALAAGRVSLMDWNSVVNAGMGGKVFQDALVRTSELLKTGAKDAIDTYGSFRESLTKGEWLTTEVLTETLKQFSGAYTEADLIAQGFTENQAKEIMSLAQTAEDAATKVKTFTQLWDVLKESAQSGWSQTWKLIIGDFEEAKGLLTPLADFLTGFINGISEARNTLLESALGTSFTSLAEKFTTSTKAIEKSVGKSVNVLKDLDEISNKVIGGQFGNGEDRLKALTEAGYNYYEVQNKVNEALDYNCRHSQELIDEQNKLLGAQTETTKSTSEASTEVSKLTENDKKLLASLSELSDEQLRSRGYTEEQIAAFKELRDTADKLGIPLAKFIDNIDQINGRWILINSFKNVGEGLVKVITAIKDAWVEVFPPITSEQLFNIIAGLHKFSTHLTVSDKTADNLKRTLKGVFAIIDIITTITGGAFKIAFDAVTQILGYFNTDILSVTASIGDAIVGFRDWIDSTLDFTNVIELMVPYIQKAIHSIREWFNGLKGSDEFEKLISCLKNATESIRDWINSLKDSNNIPGDIISGLVNGLRNGVKLVWDAAIELGKSVLEAIKSFLGIHSPSTKFAEVGRNIIDGLIQGLQNGASSVWEVIKTIGSKCVEILKNIDFGAVLITGFGVGILLVIRNFTNVLVKLFDAIEKLATPIDKLGDMFHSIGKAFDALGSKFKAQALESRSKAILNMALAIGILALAVALLTKLGPASELWNAVGIVAALAAVITGMSILIDKFGPKQSLKFTGFSMALVGMSASLLLIISAIKKIAKIEASDLNKSLKVILVLSGIMAGLIAATKLFNKDAAKVGSTLLKMATSILLMSIVIKLVSGMDAGEILKGILVISAFGGIIIGLIASTNLFAKHQVKVGATILAISAAMILLVGVVKLISRMDAGELTKGILIIGLFGGIITGLIAATKLFNKDAAKVGSTILGISAAMLLMSITIKVISGMDIASITKGLLVIGLFSGIIAGLVAITRLASDKDLTRVGTTVLLMSLSIAILAGVSTILGLIKIKNLTKGIIAITILSSMMALLVSSTKNAKKCEKTITSFAIAIGVLTVSIAALSFIDPKKIAVATASLSMVMGMFALIVNTSKSLKSVKLTPILAMIGVVATLAGVIALLSLLNVDSVLENTSSLSLLLISLSSAMFIASKAGPMAKSAIGSLALMGLVVAELALILGVMSVLDINPSVKTIGAISLLLITMSAVLVLVSHCGKSAYAGVGALALIGLVVGELAVILGLMSHFDVNPSIEVATSLSILLLSMSAALAVLGAVGMMGPAAFIGIGALATLIAGIGGLIVGIGALITEFPKLETFLDVGIPILEKIGYALGSFFGNIVGGFIGNLTSGLPDLATDLSVFMNNLQPFLNGARTIDSTIVDNVKALADTILVLTAADVINGVASIITGGSSLSDFSDQLVSFGEAMRDFSTVVSGNIDEGAVTAAANAGKVLAEMAEAIPNSGGLASIFAGENDITEFTNKLVPFGEAIAAFSSTVAGKINEDAVIAAANAGQIMIEMAEAIPNSGGLVGVFAGENDMVTFANQLVSFGQAICSFSNSVSGNINEDAVIAAANAGRIMIELANSLPNTGGVVTWFAGDNDIAKFGKSLVSFGQYFAEYANTVKDVDGSVVTTTANAAKSLIELQNGLPDSGGWFSDEASLADFGKTLSSFGLYLSQYYNHISTIDTALLSSVISQVNRLVSMAKGMTGLDVSGMSSFGTALTNLGKTGVDGFINAFSNASTRVSQAVSSMFTAAINAVNARKASLTSIFASLMDGAIRVINGKQQMFYVAGQTLMIKFIAGVKSQDINVSIITTRIMMSILTKMRDKYQEFTVVGQTLMIKFIAGIRSKTHTLITVFSGILNSILVTIRNEYTNFYSAGGYLVQGFAAGITANTFIAEARAAAMARAALAAAEEELGIESPSKAFEKEVGAMVPAGMAKGIEKNTYKAVDASTEMAEEVFDASEEAFDKKAFENEIGVMVGDGIAKGILKSSDKAVKATKEAFENSTDWIERHKKAGNLSLTDEFAAWRRVQARYKKGSEERIKADEEVSRVQKELTAAYEDYYNNVLDVQEETTEKRKKIDEDYYNSVLEVNDKLESDIQALNDKYDEAVRSRSESLYKSYGLFDKVKPSKTVFGNELINNLQNQVSAFEDWTKNLNGLSSKGLDSNLIEELRDMGISSAAEIKALNNMSEVELDQYVSLWNQKHNLANSQAVYELEGMRAETLSQIEILRTEASVKLDSYKETWIQSIQALNDESSIKLDELKTDWLQKVAGLKIDTESEFSKMANNINAIIGNSSRWSESGASIIEGILTGVANNASKVPSEIVTVMGSALDAAKKTLGINSPSKEFAKLGMYSVVGFVKAIGDRYANIYKAGSTMAEYVKNGLNDAISKIADIVNNDIDTQPTIRPVLDLSNVESDTARLNALLSRSQAMSISTGMSRVSDEEIQNGETTSRTGNVYTFTQNNYSPKALSRLEIYRQTKNQFSAMKGLVES